MKKRGRIELRVRLDPAWVEEIEARCQAEGIQEATQGRTGGPSEWLRRMVAQTLGQPLDLDPHELARERLTGQPNRHHPTLFGRPTGRRAAKLAREARARRGEQEKSAPGPAAAESWPWDEDEFPREDF